MTTTYDNNERTQICVSVAKGDQPEIFFSTTAGSKQQGTVTHNAFVLGETADCEPNGNKHKQISRFPFSFISFG